MARSNELERADLVDGLRTFLNAVARPVRTAESNRDAAPLDCIGCPRLFRGQCTVDAAPTLCPKQSKGEGSAEPKGA